MLRSQGRQYLTPLERGIQIARRNWVLLLVCFLAVPGAALVYSLAQTPEYTASASLLFTEKNTSQVDPERAAATNLQLVSLDQVAARTADALPDAGLNMTEVSEKISVSPAGESDLVDIEATDADPALSAEIANEFAMQFIAFRRDANRAKITKEEELIETRLNELTPSQLGGPEGQALEERNRELAVKATLQTGEAQLVQPATEPGAPSSPKKTRNVALGILLGLVLGISLALLRDQFDRRLKTVEEAERAFDLPVLATVPQSKQIEDGIEVTLRGEEAELFRMLRANLQYFGLNEEIRSLLITSSASEDGKTMVDLEPRPDGGARRQEDPSDRGRSAQADPRPSAPPARRKRPRARTRRQPRRDGRHPQGAGSGRASGWPPATESGGADRLEAHA